MTNTIKQFKDLPKLDEFFDYLKPSFNNISDGLLKDCIRVALDKAREILKNNNELTLNDLIVFVENNYKKNKDYNLRPLINATGIILHTNLGRSLLAENAYKNIELVSKNYVNLEYNIEEGRRGDRHSIVTTLLKKILNVEDAIVVNNNASATLLVLSSLAKNKEVIVSRGELVEIGGSFRIPDIMEQSGAILKEIGTTNKTHFVDYENATNDNTAVYLKVHTSNYRVVGFSEDVDIDEINKLKIKYNIPLVYDLGSGLMVPLNQYGINEPTVIESLNKGVDVILFSGDKLFGGPQCGIIAGKKELISKMKKNPLTRVVRVDKMTFAALEATLKEYLDMDNALKTIPTLKMLSYTDNELKDKAKQLFNLLKNKFNDNIDIEILQTENEVGGGSAPMVKLKSYAVAINKFFDLSLNDLEKKLRFNSIPIVSYINKDKLLLDIRTIDINDYNIIVDTFNYE